MEDHLNIAMKLFAPTTKIIYATPNGIQHPLDTGQVIFEMYKLESCPDTTGLIKALSKKCNRVGIMKSQRYSLSLCIALLASKGYCITSIELSGVPDTTIEVCWESLENVYVSVDEPLKSWLKITIGNRSYLAYGKQYCQQRFLSSNLKSLGTAASHGSNFKLVPNTDAILPPVVWSRDEIVYAAISLHFRHNAAEISNDIQ